VSRFCQICGCLINGRAYSCWRPAWDKDRSLCVCEQCFKNARRCPVCQAPLADSTQSRLCVTCAGLLPLCLLCAAPIPGELIYLAAKGPYCVKCAGERSRCDICGVLLDDKHQLLTDGRHICGQCHTTAVYEQSKATPVYEQVKGIIVQHLGLSLNVPTGLILVGRDQLADILQQAGRTTVHVTRTLGIYVRHGRKRAIYVQSGLPRLLLMQVAAHEWGHAWQMEKAPLLRESLYKEGFAEWVAYKVMEVIDAKQAMLPMVARDDLYGEGLRYVLKIEEGGGVLAVLNWCRQTR
jgi:hypothetical protein